MQSDGLSALDWIGAIAAAVVACFSLAVPIVVAPGFAAMFADLGGEIPGLTRLVLSTWFPPLFAVPPVALLAGAMMPGKARSIGARRGLIAGAFLAALFGVALCLYGLYAPILDLAGKIR
jgi:type II secretory pathway component PulF